MTRADAEAKAKHHAVTDGLDMAVVREGLHADEFAQLDADGQSYGYCPLLGAPMLYLHSEVVLSVPAGGTA